MFLRPLLEDIGFYMAERPERVRLGRAVQWRLGKFYYSAMRELDIQVRLREDHGLPLRYHLLADVLLRTDFWLGDDLVCVYFANPKYRDREVGRKPPAAAFLGQATPPFTIHHVGIERQGFGKFWIASDASIADLARRLGA
ncbi:hypothetical protein E5F05_09250 [Deinococcus metallilatus]|uniref:Uncharacterized protein n=1 Tax=Deinococcus metallilatus TaxID=1211322 RepID=A0AAJ5JX77_9DEIO|nr:hypothetical protein [Deinococcus metallilatus]MBB5295346.1 hypothetical protein [Deinococcus metallilatus]QBY08115.1 hypothetical protein E5F05_09250 [Deinococcus metallilatus]RXJ12450.1 hypothetical protein ERJ73_08075 [Deinococcus metallilatus]TLK21067.1 hypothetical protein FCS05_19460 [Deinococcus metallilatus]GMA16023.1 hypothetical protein GCM10025871_23540 [Deinococcus metallilatus]